MIDGFMPPPDGGANVIRKYDGFYISWNESLDETAIVIQEPSDHWTGTYYILMGNHAQEYRRLADKGGLAACQKYFRDHIDQIGFWSAPLPEEEPETLEATAEPIDSQFEIVLPIDYSQFEMDD